MKPWIINLSFVLFGTFAGLLLFEFVYEKISPNRGMEFETIDDIRKAMLTPSKESFPVAEEVKRANLRDIVVPHPDDQIIFDLKPGFKTVFQGKPLNTNSWGMRNKEISVERTPYTRRIVVLGDSFGFGWGVEEDERFSSVMERTLNSTVSKYNNLNYEVINMSVPGYSTFQEVAKFKESGLILDPDIVMVFFVQNDFGLPFFVKNIENKGAILPATTFVQKQLSKLSEEEKQKALPPRFDPNFALQELSDILKERGTRLVLVFNTRSDWNKDRQRLWVLRKNPHIEVLDLATPFFEILERYNIDKERLVLPDDPHPSAFRHEVWGVLLSTLLN